jgi:transcriptional regulator with XRE-family HTH domain
MNYEVAERLAELRRAKGLSQEELAHELGLSRQAVSKWERAESSPDTDNLIALAKLYGMTLDELVHGPAEAVGHADSGDEADAPDGAESFAEASEPTDLQTASEALDAIEAAIDKLESELAAGNKAAESDVSDGEAPQSDTGPEQVQAVLQQPAPQAPPPAPARPATQPLETEEAASETTASPNESLLNQASGSGSANGGSAYAHASSAGDATGPLPYSPTPPVGSATYAETEAHVARKVAIAVVTTLAVLGLLVALVTMLANRSSSVADAPSAEVTEVPAGEPMRIETPDQDAGGGFVAASDVTSLSIRWVSGGADIVVVRDEETGGNIEFDEVVESGDNAEAMTYTLQNGRLTLLYGQPGAAYNMCNTGFAPKQLTVKIPESCASQLGVFELEAGSGHYVVGEGIVCRELDVDVASGTVTIDSIDADDVELEAASGDLSVGGMFGLLDVDVASGSVAVSCVNAVPSQVDADIASGRFELLLPADRGFTARVEVRSGNVSSEFPGTTSSGGRHKAVYAGGDGSVKVDAEVASGELVFGTSD